MSALLASGDVDVLVPLGALEQHGPHLPLGTDAAIAEATAIEVARRVGDCLVAPCLPVGDSKHHLAFPGTASLPLDVVAGYVSAVATTLLGHGFRHVYVMSAHAGNIPAMKAALDELPVEARGRVSAFVDWPGQRTAMHDWARSAYGLSPEEVGSHSGHFETSIMLRIAPEAVDRAAIPRGHVGPVGEASKLMNEKGIDAVSEIGVIGDARASTPEAGDGYLDILVGSVADFIARHRSERDRS